MIRAARPEDIPAVFALVNELAEFERLSHEVLGTQDDLKHHVFETGACKLLVIEVEAEIIGYAIYFHNFSTFLMKPGIYLEDVYVTPAYRGKGYGKSMLQFLVALAKESGFGRVEWSVLDWNQPAIDFYRSIGAEVMEDWRICRIRLS